MREVESYDEMGGTEVESHIDIHARDVESYIEIDAFELVLTICKSYQSMFYKRQKWYGHGTPAKEPMNCR